MSLELQRVLILACGDEFICGDMTRVRLIINFPISALIHKKIRECILHFQKNCFKAFNFCSYWLTNTTVICHGGEKLLNEESIFNAKSRRHGLPVISCILIFLTRRRVIMMTERTGVVI